MEGDLENGRVGDPESPCRRSPATGPEKTRSESETYIGRPARLCPPGAGSYRRRSCAGRKLVLHLDVRNTILVADSVDDVNVEQALNSFLTGVTWGRDTENGWQWYSEQPSLRSPNPHTITYYKHLEKKLVRIPSDRVILRRATGDFTQEEIGRKFLSYFDKHLKHLEWHHSESNDKLLTMKGKDRRLYHYILPSFYRLIYHLYNNNRNFSIIIRTYGLDAPNVLQSIKHTFSGSHPEFPQVLPIKVNTKPGKIIRQQDAISAHVQTDKGTSVLRGDREIYDYMCQTTGVSAFVDGFCYWQSNGYRSSAGKPFWIDPSRTDVQHIFFDDNIRVTDADSIVDVRIFSPAFPDEARSVCRDEAMKFENMCLVQADLLESISNRDYFINKVDVCERKFDEYIRTISKR